MNDKVTSQESAREFDVIVWGATGFTGKLVADYLATQYGVGADLRWAIAGRSADKLQSVRVGLGDAAKGLELITADSHDRPSLDAMAARTKVILTTVGPYALYGSELVAACVEAGTHYCDLAGEVQWIRSVIDTHQERAQETGARIVNCCGFDSVPMDIGVWFLQETAKQQYGSYCESIKLFVKATSGGASGGTIASLLNAIKASREDRSVAKILVHPYSLNPEGQREGPDGRDQQAVEYSDDARSWTAPFVMATVNTKVVRRSHALLGYPYGEDFRYGEAVLTGRGVAGWMKAATVVAGLGTLMTSASFSATRALLEKFILPKPGEGPTPEQQRDGFFNLMQIGTLPDGRQIRTRITGDRDPGYGSTSKMLSECAVCLARDELQVGGGVLTPAAAMAAPLLERLRSNAGLTFELRS